MAQTYCAINPWLCLIFSVKYRQGLKTFFKQNISQKNVHATILKGNIMGYDQHTVPDTVAVEPTFVAFLIAHANIRPWPLVPFFQIPLKNSELKTTHNTFRAFFRQPFLVCLTEFELLGDSVHMLSFDDLSKLNVIFVYNMKQFGSH